MSTALILAAVAVALVVAGLVFCRWATVRKRRDVARILHEDQALAVVADRLPRPALTGKERRVLTQLGERRAFASDQDLANARMLADSWRKIAPDLEDVLLGRLALDWHGWMVAALQGSPNPGWAMERMTKAAGYAAVELTELERTEAPK